MTKATTVVMRGGRPKPARGLTCVRSGTMAAGLLTAGCCILAGSSASQDTSGDIDSTRAVIEKWVETRQIISQEKKDWTLGKEILTDRIELMNREIQTMRDRIGEAESSISETDKVRTELVEENESLKHNSATLSDTVAALEARVGSLMKRLPEPIRDRVRPLSQRLSENPAQSKVGLAERYQIVIGILNEIDKFNREITVTSEVRELPDGTSAEVATIYVGLGQAYYVGANNTIAGIGRASADGWIWTPANEAAAEIARAIAILKKEQPASFVRMPLFTK